MYQGKKQARHGNGDGGSIALLQGSLQEAAETGLLENSANPFSALFGGSVCVVRGLGASSVTFCHYNRDVLFQLPVAAGPATLPDDPSCVETWLSPELRLMTQDNNGISIRTDQWVKYDLSLQAFFWIFGT